MNCTPRRALSAGAAAVVVIVALTTASAAVAQTAAPTTATTTPAATTGGGSSDVRGVTPTTIKVSGIVTASLYGGAAVGARARFDRANAAGGVNGRKIEFAGVTDDSGSTEGNRAAVAKLADSDSFAVVPAVSADMAGASELVNAQLPFFGWALSSKFCGYGYGFGYSGCITSSRLTSSAWGLTVKQGFAAPNPLGNTAAILADDTPAGEYALGQVRAGLRAAGLRVTAARATLPVPPGGDYATILKDVLVSNGGKAPRAIFVVGSYSNVVGVQQVLRDTAYPGTFTNLVQYDPNLVAQASGASVFVQTAPTEAAATTPAMAQLVADVKKVAPEQPVTQAVIAGYLSADMFLAAVQRAGKNLTVGKLLNAANKGFTYELTGVAGPTKFPAGHDVPTPCGSLVRSNGVAFEVVTPYTCGKVVKVPGS